MTINSLTIILSVYFVVINIAAAIMTVVDKRRAINDKWRISEKALLLIGFFGGAAGEYLTMKKIHHKTKHGKFMIGLPLEIMMHVVIIALIIAKAAN